MSTAEPTGQEQTCANCASHMTGRYCSVCGQDSRGPPTRPLPLLGLFFSYASGIEGATLRTMRALLFQPG